MRCVALYSRPPLRRYLQLERLHRSYVVLVLLIEMMALGGWVQPASAQQRDVEVGKKFEFTVPPGLETPRTLHLEQFFQEGPKCGPNALFIVLSLTGVKCSYSEVLASIPLTDRGASFADLKSCAEKFGLPCEVRKDISPEEVASAPMPIILHLKGGNPRNGGLPWQHFTVVVGPHPKSDEAYIGVDTGNGSVVNISKKVLARNMTGYALLITGRSSTPQISNSAHALFPQLVWGTAFVLGIANVAMFVSHVVHARAAIR